MSEIDWSQFYPNLIVTVIGVMLTLILGGVVAYFRVGKFKTFLNNLLSKLRVLLNWLYRNWRFFGPFIVVVILEAVTFNLYTDWRIVILAFVFYAMGLLGWGLSIYHQMAKSKNNPISKPKATFLPILLGAGTGNDYLKNYFIDPPVGDIFLGGAQFQLMRDSSILDTNKPGHFQTLKDGSKASVLTLPEPVIGVKAICVLINSENSKWVYTNENIGKVKLVFDDAPPIEVDLVLGKNVREWCPGHPGDYVRETTSLETKAGVWKGLSKDGANAVIDCLRIPVYEVVRSCGLKKIVFVHKSSTRPPADTMGVHYVVFGLSAEVEQASNSQIVLEPEF